VFPAGTNIIYIYKSKAILVTGRGGSLVFPVRYEHHVHIKGYSYPCNIPWWPIRVSAVRYKHYLHIKSKTIPITGRGGP
jgi:hypothetical protein